MTNFSNVTSYRNSLFFFSLAYTYVSIVFVSLHNYHVCLISSPSFVHLPPLYSIFLIALCARFELQIFYCILTFPRGPDLVGVYQSCWLSVTTIHSG